MKSQAERFDEMEGRFDIDLQEAMYHSDSVTIRSMFIPAGYSVGKHKHDYSHLSVLQSGRVIVSADGIPDREFSGDAVIEIKAGVYHTIHALDDSVWLCVHARQPVDDNLKLVKGG